MSLLKSTVDLSLLFILYSLYFFWWGLIVLSCFFCRYSLEDYFRIENRVKKCFTTRVLLMVAEFFLESLLFWATCISFSCFPHMGNTEQQKLNYENLIEWTNALKYIPILVP